MIEPFWELGALTGTETRSLKVSLRNLARLPWRAAPRDLTDADLIDAISSGDEKALERLYERYFRKLVGFAVRITDRTETAEEVAADTLLAVWRGAGSYEGRSRPSTWIFGIAYRIALKARKRSQRALEEDAVELIDEMHGVDGEEVLENLFLRRELARALHQLSPEHRAVIQLTYYYGYSYPEIAEILGCPEGTVKSRMSHARARLSKCLTNVNNDTGETQND